MAKKSFLDNNPALAYISAIQTQETEDTTCTDNTEHTHVAPVTPKPKKKETKNRRVNLIMAPSLHSDLTILAHIQRVSLNELVSRVMGEYVAEKHGQIQKYLTITGED